VYLREGQVLEAGTHATLMAQGVGAYRRLIESETLPAA
jgi:ABC-type multidrug transport system fused ATPase/permease subunit